MRNVEFEQRLCLLISDYGKPKCGQTCCEKCYIENSTIWLDYFKGEINGTNEVSQTTDS